ncbi:MAG: LysM peptidoglycan-binding domain-containing protein [Thermodesulfobacteriota bacterium]
MKRFFCILFIVTLTVSFVFILAPFAQQEKKEGEEIYTIKQGDTLWDISAKFLKDPFLWPKLWQRNPYITNPHWIYPGHPVRILPAEELMKEVPKEAVTEPEIRRPEAAPEEAKPAVPEAKPEEKAEVKPAEVKPEIERVEVKPLEERPLEERPAVFPEVRSAGFVGDINFRGIGMILDNRDGKNLLSEGDIVYMAFRTVDPVMVGNKYTIFRPDRYVRHPVTKRKIGMKYLIAGNVQVIDQQGNFYTGKIVEAFDAVRTGDLLRPYLKDR